MAIYLLFSVLVSIFMVTSPLPRQRQSNCYNDKLAIADIGPCVNAELGLLDQHGLHHHRQRRVASTDDRRKWAKSDDGFVYIPMCFDGNDTKVIEVMEEAMKIFHEKTCIRFIPKNSSHVESLKIVNHDGCYSHVGCQGGEQIISMQASSACQRTGVAVHELLHALGSYHEMRRCDRDQYVTVNTENIWDNRRSQFAKLDCRNTTTYNETYDTMSILHYGNYAAAIDYDVMTIVSKKDPTEKLGQQNEMSANDIEAINRRYECHSYLENNS